MSRQVGHRWLTCPYHGEKYKLTNWMVRRAAGWNKDAARWEDTHLLSCTGRTTA